MSVSEERYFYFPSKWMAVPDAGHRRLKPKEKRRHRHRRHRHRRCPYRRAGPWDKRRLRGGWEGTGRGLTCMRSIGGR